MSKKNKLNLIFGSLTLLWLIRTLIVMFLILPQLTGFWGIALMTGIATLDASFVWILLVINFDFRHEKLEGEL